MSRRTILVSCIMVFVLILTSFTQKAELSKSLRIDSILNSSNHEFSIVSTKQEAFKNETFPTLGKSFISFKEALGFQESRNQYQIVNKFGYVGKYQFGSAALETFHIYDTKKFLNDPQLQEKAFIALCSVNKWMLRREIRQFVGKKIDGIKITESGMLAGAHLAGASSVKKFLKSNGNQVFHDGFGTSVKKYMKKFAGYDTSNIIPSRNPTI